MLSLCTRCGCGGPCGFLMSTMNVQERQRERAAVDAERDANFKRAMTFLLEQQRDLRSGGQKGMHKTKPKA